MISSIWYRRAIRANQSGSVATRVRKIAYGLRFRSLNGRTSTDANRMVWTSDRLSHLSFSPWRIIFLDRAPSSSSSVTCGISVAGGSRRRRDWSSVTQPVDLPLYPANSISDCRNGSAASPPADRLLAATAAAIVVSARRAAGDGDRSHRRRDSSEGLDVGERRYWCCCRPGVESVGRRRWISILHWSVGYTDRRKRRGCPGIGRETWICLRW